MTQLPAVPATKIIRQEEVQHWLDGYAFVAAAKAEAQAQMDKMSEICEASRKEGYQTGFEQGAREAAALLTATTARVNSYVATLDQQIVDLSLSIITKIFGKFDDADLVARLAEHALQGFQRERDITISVAPDIAEEVSQRINSEYAHESLNITVLADPHLRGTKCVLSNAIAVIDAGLETQLAAIREALVDHPAKDGAS
ncbi:type III secretion system stator protein SctL (plasmid) [Phyllobacterium sp. A18/5-2]|uniref:type III secretion system stator protein SctL n=1 Tax=Phyllobacterium sp. A18/5-2 TaxID=2978392 RepID=UPI0021C8ABC4|nr:type III secretion system stator protein SctL [Phyllobacterium sp. A18/5-2]UXN66887.1 type III secretion system stator protein SctL [Phyllobacterium sp. A18/5-2]